MDDQALIEIGRVAANSAVLELATIMTFASLLDTDPAVARILAPTTLDRLLTTLKQIALANSHPEASEISNWVASALETNRNRNLVIHGAWATMDSDPEGITRLNIRALKNSTWTADKLFEPWTTDRIKHVADDLADAVGRLAALGLNSSQPQPND